MTAPSFTRMRCTSAPVRISAPASRAASAIARVTAPGPPAAVTLLPPGTGSLAAPSSSTAPVPADHGPIAVPWIARAATLACSRSVSNHSATRSATAIGPQRRSAKDSFLPSARNLRPVLRSSHTSPADGESIDGGVISSSSDRNPPIRPSVAQSSGKRVASFAENGRMASAVRPGSVERIERPAVGRRPTRAWGRGRRTSRRAVRAACRGRSRDGAGPACAPASRRDNPGAKSSPIAQPPIVARRSRTSGALPPFAR